MSRLEKQTSNRVPEKVWSNNTFQNQDGDIGGSSLAPSSPRSPGIRMSEAGGGSRLTPTGSIGRRARMASLTGDGRRGEAFDLDDEAPPRMFPVKPKSMMNSNSASTPIRAFAEDIRPIKEENPGPERRVPHSPSTLSKSVDAWEREHRLMLQEAEKKRMSSDPRTRVAGVSLSVEAVKSPGPSGAMVHCFVKRSKDFFGGYPSYMMHLEANGTFILAARKRKKTKLASYVMSVSQDDLKRDTENCISKLKLSDKGNEYTLYQRQGDLYNQSGEDYSYASELCVSYAGSGSEYAAPRNILCALPSPSAMMPGAAKPLDPSAIIDMVRSNDLPSHLHRKVTVLCNKIPEFDSKIQMFALDFKGRVKVPSVKNFQMTLWDPSDPDQSKQDSSRDIVLQFGKMRDEIYSLDFAWPLNAQMALAIALTSFDKTVR